MHYLPGVRVCVYGCVAVKHCVLTCASIGRCVHVRPPSVRPHRASKWKQSLSHATRRLHEDFRGQDGNAAMHPTAEENVAN